MVLYRYTNYTYARKPVPAEGKLCAIVCIARATCPVNNVPMLCIMVLPATADAAIPGTDEASGEIFVKLWRYTLLSKFFALGKKINIP
jgi:hypothetical protein